MTAIKKGQNFQLYKHFQYYHWQTSFTILFHLSIRMICKIPAQYVCISSPTPPHAPKKPEPNTSHQELLNNSKYFNNNSWNYIRNITYNFFTWIEWMAPINQSTCSVDKAGKCTEGKNNVAAKAHEHHPGKWGHTGFPCLWNPAELLGLRRP